MLSTIEIPLGDLVIGKGQARTREPNKNIDQLVASIDKVGLLQPIVVCKSTEVGKWEILTGQRRFLAHKILKRDSITAAVVDGRVDEAEAKAISITENLIRRKRLAGTELIDGITFLYNHVRHRVEGCTRGNGPYIRRRASLCQVPTSLCRS